ncbi:MAG: hypothetical protein KGM44_05720 [bacterium]|nr:hypothetical protein [bacterium]
MASATSWMHADSTAKSVGFDIQMAENGNNGTFNFNGYARGELTITVPVGWKVQMHVVNTGEGAIPHSLEIAKVTEAMPAQGVDPAFSQAYTVQLIPGMAVGAKDEVEFTASEPGKYWMLCGVPGHAAGGMWDWFVISSTASAPAVTIGKGS